MTVIHARAPLRLGLAGGGTDLTPYREIYGGCVLNATIDRYAYATIKTHENSLVRLKASDIKIEEEFLLAPQIPVDGALKLHKAVYNHMIKQNIELIKIRNNSLHFKDKNQLNFHFSAFILLWLIGLMRNFKNNYLNIYYNSLSQNNYRNLVVKKISIIEENTFDIKTPNGAPIIPKDFTRKYTRLGTKTALKTAKINLKLVFL